MATGPRAMTKGPPKVAHALMTPEGSGLASLDTESPLRGVADWGEDQMRRSAISSVPGSLHEGKKIYFANKISIQIGPCMADS